MLELVFQLNPICKIMIIDMQNLICAESSQQRNESQRTTAQLLSSKEIMKSVVRKMKLIESEALDSTIASLI